ncbi:SDR family oxidoreductase [Microvirga arsenatis]|uniref:NAD-dependent epimerase/dehydratase family protein n=1 Tax=Microvirga arsenatis TaxID=2692265 RepID=A0ABW9YT43_9HYPH|nr:SDR family oxidoreductase [Microvirga arsenatis]NBJ10075.1 NAD-dependent epimerase/dehydratase family protein [Microvirga arsenatis]NBJ23143.1 NAD-dependent epimerase/dehydratase family protein [Microvirga arsenatis]
MNLFVFGLGYTALQFIAHHRTQCESIAGTVRSVEKAGILEKSGVRAFRFDGAAYDPRILDCLSQADALLISVPPSGGTDPVLTHFSDAIASAPKLRWVGYLSTVGVYGNADGAWVDETTPPNPATARARSRIAAEQEWLALGDKAAFAVQIFRLAGIYGPGRNALLKVADGTAKRVVKPGQVFNRIHTEDIAQVLWASIERPSRNAIYNVADDEPGPPQDVIAYAAELLGCEPPPEISFEEAEQTPMARSFYEDNKRVRNTRIKTDLGVTLRYPTFRHGLRALHRTGEGMEAGTNWPEGSMGP